MSTAFAAAAMSNASLGLVTPFNHALADLDQGDRETCAARILKVLVSRAVEPDGRVPAPARYTGGTIFDFKTAKRTRYMEWRIEIERPQPFAIDRIPKIQSPAAEKRRVDLDAKESSLLAPLAIVYLLVRRAAVDYAHCMRDLVDVHYPDAACIRVV